MEEIKQAKVTIVTVMEVPFQNSLQQKIKNDVPMTLTNIILADSTPESKSFWNSMITDDALGQLAFVQESNYELFKKEMLIRIKSTVKTVLVIFCDHGLAFLKQIFSGLNRFNSICSILIYCTGSMEENEIKKESWTKDLNV